MKIALLLVCSVLSLQPAEQSGSAAARLSHVTLFAFGGVGFAGVITQGEKDYNSILASSTAQADFEKLAASGSAEGKAYALVALRKVDPDKFKLLVASLRNSPTPVRTGHGCFLSKEQMGDLVKRIEAGEYTDSLHR